MKNPLAIITTGTGYFKAGLRGVITEGSERTVFLGAECSETKLPEFTVLLDGSKLPRQFCQYGRDFVFADRS